jgi:hypothetical protein
MKKIYGRVAIEFEVDEEIFKANPEQALMDALENGRARYDGGDSYLPGPWNEESIADDVEFYFDGNKKIKLVSE